MVVYAVTSCCPFNVEYDNSTLWTGSSNSLLLEPVEVGVPNNLVVVVSILLDVITLVLGLVTGDGIRARWSEGTAFNIVSYQNLSSGMVIY